MCKENKYDDFIRQFLLFRISLLHAFTRVPQCMRVGPAATVLLANQIFGCSFGRLWNYGLEFMSNKVFFLGYVNVKGTFHFIVLSRLWERTFECSNIKKIY